MRIEIKEIVKLQEGDFGESWPGNVGVAVAHLVLEGYIEQVAGKFIKEADRVAPICGGNVGKHSGDLTREGEVIHRAEHFIVDRLLDGYALSAGTTAWIEGMAVNEAVMSVAQRGTTSEEVGEKLVAGVGFCNGLLGRIRRGMER